MNGGILGLAQPSSAGVINDCISGLILIVATIGAKWLKDGRDETRKLHTDFQLHTQSDAENFKAIRRQGKKAARTAKLAADTARAVAAVVGTTPEA